MNTTKGTPQSRGALSIPSSRPQDIPPLSGRPQPCLQLKLRLVSSGIKHIYWNVSHEKRFSLGHSHARGGREATTYTQRVGRGPSLAPRGSGARGVVAAEALVHAVQQVLGQAVPRAGQHLLEADHGLQAQPGDTGLLSAGRGWCLAAPEGLGGILHTLSPGSVEMFSGVLGTRAGNPAPLVFESQDGLG